MRTLTQRKHKKKKQIEILELKSKMTLLKNLQESFDIRLDQAEEIISDLKDTYLKRSEKKKKE